MLQNRLSGDEIGVLMVGERCVVSCMRRNNVVCLFPALGLPVSLFE